jgi:hypothetical protein
MTEPERYLAVDMMIIEAIRKLWLEDVDQLKVPTVMLLLRVVRIDEISGQLVLGIRMTRDLDPPEKGIGSI